MSEKKYLVEVLNKSGTCDNTLFEKMAKKGDITSIKVSDLIGNVVKITGYAECRIETDEKNFVIYYFDTEEYGLISSGSEIFYESVTDYMEEVEFVRLTEIKTKKGKTYKAVPILNKEQKTQEENTNKNELTKNEDLPF